MQEEDRKKLNDLNREALLLQTDLAEARIKFKKQFANLRLRTKALLKKLDRKE